MLDNPFTQFEQAEFRNLFGLMHRGPSDAKLASGLSAVLSRSFAKLFCERGKFSFGYEVLILHGQKLHVRSFFDYFFLAME
jgi:hypothetical protein